MNRHSLILVLVALIIAAATYSALPHQAIAGDAAKVEMKTIKGKVAQTDKGVFVLKSTWSTWWRSYRPSGMDLSRYLGEKVKVTGTVSKDKNGWIVNVVKVEKRK
jgi:hypothetical protein